MQSLKTFGCIKVSHDSSWGWRNYLSSGIRPDIILSLPLEKDHKRFCGMMVGTYMAS